MNFDNHLWDLEKLALYCPRSSDVASRACRPQVIWTLRPLCFYGWRLSRTVPACCTGTTCQNLCGWQILCARLDFHHFLWKIKNSISASKCNITAPKIRTWSQLLPKFSYHIHKLPNGGRPWFWPRLPEIGCNPQGVWEGGGKRRRRAPLIAFMGGGGWEGEGREGRGGQGGEREQICPCTKCSHAHVDYTLSLFLISLFCCCSLSRYKKVLQERYTVRPESYKIVMIIFYLSLWTKYLFDKISLKKKYLHRQNIGKEKIAASQKYRYQQNIAAGKILVKKKYRNWKNIGFNKISLPTKYWRRNNIDIAKISVSTKYRCRLNIGEEKI